MPIKLLILTALATSFLHAGDARMPVEIIKLYTEVLDTRQTKLDNHIVIMDLQEFPKTSGTIFLFQEGGSLKVFKIDGGNLLETKGVNKSFTFDLQVLREAFQATIDHKKMMSRMLALDADRFVFISKNYDNFVFYVMREDQSVFIKKLLEIEMKIQINEKN